MKADYAGHSGPVHGLQCSPFQVPPRLDVLCSSRVPRQEDRTGDLLRGQFQRLVVTFHEVGG